MIRIPGLSSARVSEEIPMPDIGQLLVEPFFFDTDIHDAYSNGSDFQRLLLDSIPDLGAYGHNVISVMSEVRLLGPDFRACTIPSEDDMQEWHIDDESGIDGDSDYVWAEEGDRVHLYTNQTSAMTEFLKDDLVLPNLNPEDFTFDSFMAYFHDYYKRNKLETAFLPANRIVTFTNHLHRANNPQNYEFRYMFRVVETNRARPAGIFDESIQESTVTDLNEENTANISKEEGVITIYVPGEGFVHEEHAEWTPGTPVETKQQEQVSQPVEAPEPAAATAEVSPQAEEDPYTVVEDDTPIPEPRRLSQNDPIKSLLENTESEYPQNPAEKFTTMEVQHLCWETTLMPNSTDLVKLSPKKSVAVISKGTYNSKVSNDNLLEFFKKMNKTAHLRDDEGNMLKGAFKFDYYDNDTSLGPIAGAFFVPTPRALKELVPGRSYSLIVDTTAEYHYIIPEDLKVTIPEDFTP